MTEEKKKIPLHRERLGLSDGDNQQKLRQDKIKLLRADLKEVFGSAAGRRVLKYIMALTGWRRGVIGGNPSLGLDAIHGSFYNASRLQVMVELSEYVAPEILKDCEFGVFEDLA